MKEHLSLWLRVYDLNHLVTPTPNTSTTSPSRKPQEQYYLFWPGHGKDSEKALASLLKAAALSPRRRQWGGWPSTLSQGNSRGDTGTRHRPPCIHPPSLLLHLPALMHRYLSLQPRKELRNK